MNYKIILVTLLSIIWLSGCGVQKESPIWYMTSDDKEIDSYFKQLCLDYGYQLNTPGLRKCIRQERRVSSSNASNRIYQAGVVMERAGTPMMYKNQNSNSCRYNPLTQRYQICISPSVMGCAGYGAGC